MRTFFNSDRRLAILLLITMLFLLGIVAYQQSQTVYPPLAAASPQPDGAKGLFLWLEELGYEVEAPTLAAFHIPAEVELVLVLEPRNLITEAELDELGRWVQAGGTLLIAGDSPVVTLVFEYFEFNSRFEQSDEVRGAAVPLLLSPPLTAGVTAHTESQLITERTDYVPLLTNAEQPLLVSFTAGDGRVLLSTSSYFFRNEAIMEADNAALALNIASLVEPNSTIWFDEWHHGIRRGDVDNTALSGPGEWLRFTAAGQSLLYILAVVFIAIILSGWRFGRPVPLPRDLRRRAPLEYITAIANLNRRAGHRYAVQQQYKQQLKRQLAQRYRLNPNLPDDEYVQQLAAYNPAVDKGQLSRLLQRLNQRKTSENELLEVAQEVNNWLQKV